MSAYKTFAVAGCGGLGRCILDALLEKKKEGVISSVIVLSRSPNDDLEAKGVKVAVVDYASASSVQPVLAGVDVLISTIGTDYTVQDGLAVGAKAAGVQLFVPSEWGIPTDGATEGFFAQKDALKKKLKNELKLPYVAYYNGCFPDWYFEKGRAEAIGFDFANGKFSIGGVGDRPIPWASRPDIGRFVAHTLTVLPRNKLEWRSFRLQADKISFNEIAEEYKARSGRTVTISHRSRAELEDALTKNPKDIYTWLLLKLDEGTVDFGKSELNQEFPDWNPKKVVDYLLEVYGW